MSISDKYFIRELHSFVNVEGIPDVLSNGIRPRMEQQVSQFAELYFNGHNPDLKKQLKMNPDTCVVQINPRGIDFSTCLVQIGPDQYPAQTGITKLNLEHLYAEHWVNKETSLAENRALSVERCAKLIIPGGVRPECVSGICVGSPEVKNTIQTQSPYAVPISVNPAFFFIKSPPLQESAIKDPVFSDGELDCDTEEYIEEKDAVELNYIFHSPIRKHIIELDFQEDSPQPLKRQRPFDSD